MTDSRKPGVTSSADSALIKTVQDYIALVRAKLRDYPELNRLIEGHESSDRMLAMALMQAVDDYNTTPPLLGNVSITAFPSVDLLVDGTIIQVLESVGLLQTRNQVSFADEQGTPLGVNDKSPLIMQWLNVFRPRYEQKKFRLKQAINLRDALHASSGVSSEYLAVNGYFSSFDDE